MSLLTIEPETIALGNKLDSARTPVELIMLRDRVRRMAPAIRAELEPIVEDAIEEAWFRGQILTVARDALARLRLDLAMARFRLDSTRVASTRVREERSAHE